MIFGVHVLMHPLYCIESILIISLVLISLFYQVKRGACKIQWLFFFYVFITGERRLCDPEHDQVVQTSKVQNKQCSACVHGMELIDIWMLSFFWNSDAWNIYSYDIFIKLIWNIVDCLPLRYLWFCNFSNKIKICWDRRSVYCMSVFVFYVMNFRMFLVPPKTALDLIIFVLLLCIILFCLQ